MKPGDRCAMIGTRNPEDVTPELKYLFVSAARLLSSKGITIVTGAAPFCDQLAAQIALRCSGKVEFKLPYTSFERDWLEPVLEYCRPLIDVEVWDQVGTTHLDWTKSVDLYHPAPGRLSLSARGFMARNYGIVAPCQG